MRFSFWFSLFVLCLAIPAFATGGAEAGEAAAQETVELEFWAGWGSEVDAGIVLQESIDAFNESQDRISVDYIQVSWGEIIRKMIVQVNAGNPPDAHWNWVNRISSLAAQGYLTDLTPFYERDWKKINGDDLYTSRLAMDTYRDKIYGVPFSIEIFGLYYNIERFKEVGLDPDKPPRNIAELEEYAKRLTEFDDKGNITRLGYLPTKWGVSRFAMAQAFGGEFFNQDMTEVTPDHPGIISFLEWLGKYYADYGVDNLERFIGGLGGDYGRHTPSGGFYNGDVAMFICGPWWYESARQYAPDLRYGIAKVPGPAGVNSPTMLSGVSFTVPDGVKNAEASWEFLSFLMGPDHITSVSLGDGLAARRSVAENPNVMAEKFWLQQFVPLMDNASASVWESPVSMEYRNQFGAAFDYVTFGEKTPEQAAAEIKADLQPKLDDLLKAQAQ